MSHAGPPWSRQPLLDRRDETESRSRRRFTGKLFAVDVVGSTVKETTLGFTGTTQDSGRAPAATGVIIAIALIACNKDPSPAPASSTTTVAANTGVATDPGGQPALPPCSIVTIPEVESTLGVQGLQGPQVNGEPPVRACAFTRAPLNLPAVTVRFEVGRDARDFATIRKNHEEHGQPTRDFPGLGDAAATVSMDGRDLGITFLYKKTVVFVTTVYSPIDKQIALARMVAKRM